MTTRPEHSIRARARRFTAAAVVAAAGLTVPFASPAGTAEAAVPAEASTWSSLMYRSLTADETRAQLRKTLATRKTEFVTAVAGVSAAKTSNGIAQNKVTAATAADDAAREQLAAAVQAAADAKKNLAAVSKQKPRNEAAIARATSAVAAAVKTVNSRKAQVERASGVLNEARSGARSATTAVNAAIAAWKAASVAVSRTEQRLAGVGTAADWLARATAVSRDVVTKTRPVFTVADTTQVYGITVHKNVAYAFKRMIDDAKADGIAISGGGFRTKQRQIELRKINGCPDIWTAPASSCRVPTAIPGRSLHEIGMAVDITSGGKSLTSKTPAFAWLKAHAAAYGFVNLPAEAWHWSITGG